MLLLTLQDIAQCLLIHYWELARKEPFVIGEIYCPRCGDNRRMRAQSFSCDESMLRPSGPPLPPDIRAQVGPSPPISENILRSLVPSLFSLDCVQCDALFTLVIYDGDVGPSFAIIPSVQGGLSTPNTPGGVRYYLDQAARSHALGADTAAIAMFRAALDFLLFEQNLRGRMLGDKIQNLEERLKNGTAPKWAKDLNTEFLRIIKDLGNASIHPGKGDISRQTAIDTNLYIQVVQTFQELLHLVYELPVQTSMRLSKLRSTSATLKK